MTLTIKHLKYSAKPNKHIYYYPLIEKEKQCHHFMLSQEFLIINKEWWIHERSCRDSQLKFIKKQKESRLINVKRNAIQIIKLIAYIFAAWMKWTSWCNRVRTFGLHMLKLWLANLASFVPLRSWSRLNANMQMQFFDLARMQK